MSAVFIGRDQSERCIICWDDTEEARLEEGPIVNHQLLHGGFHRNCLSQWFREGDRNCPLCRVPLSTRSLEVLRSGDLGRRQRAINAMNVFRGEHPIIHDFLIVLMSFPFFMGAGWLGHQLRLPENQDLFSSKAVRELVMGLIILAATFFYTIFIVEAVAFAQWMRETP